MGIVGKNYSHFKERVGQVLEQSVWKQKEVLLVAVSKNTSIEKMQEAYDAGCRDFGESRAKEGINKISHFPSDIQWHFIGTLQKNKVKAVLQSFSLIHSVDTPELAKAISDAATKLGIIARVLIQVNMSGEEAKHGLSAEAWRGQLEAVNKLPNIQFEGLMTMAPLTDDPDKIRSCFSGLRKLREEFAPRMQAPQIFSHLSMGMSNDFELAIEEGATIVRLGSAIFS